ncbi:MAG: SMI1/KNR4 family protein [Elainellaceae cyanobacterium]
MVVLPNYLSERLSRLTKQIAIAPSCQTSEAVYQAGVLLILSARGQAAYVAFSYLLEGELRLSTASSLLPRLARVLPSLCYVLGVTCPKLPNRPAMSFAELTQHVSNEEQNWRSMILADRWLQLPLPEGRWTREYLDRMTGPGERPSFTEITQFRQEIFRMVQHRAADGRLTEAVELIDLYQSVRLAWNLDNKDWLSEEIQTIAIDTYFRAGYEQKAKQYIAEWWQLNKTSQFPVFAYPIAAMRAILYGALRGQINIAQTAVDDFLDTLRSRSYISFSGKSPTATDWQDFMERWNHKIFTAETDVYDGPCDCFPEVIAQQQCGQQGAAEEEILELETRLGMKLPPSYRTFLSYSNGWFLLNECSVLLSTHEVNWFAARNQNWIDAWVEAGTEGEVSDEQYFQYGERQDPVFIRCEYLQTALQISADEDGYVYLLNPKVIDENGEWEAWEFDNQIPGAYRYRSFWEMMQATYHRSFGDNL